MKMRRHNAFIATLFLCLISCCLTPASVAQQKTDSLRFQIKVEKDTFLLSESIWLDLYLKNIHKEQVGAKPLSPGGGWLEFIVVNSSNDTLIPYAREVIDFAGGGPTYLLEPNETLYVCRDLLEATGLGEREEKWMPERSYLKPDVYKIKAIYKKHLESNELIFAVVNPTGAEKTAHRIWKEGHAYQVSKEFDSSIEKWKELIDNYPESAYAASTLRELCYYDKQNSIKHAQMLLSTNPNSGYSGYAIGILLEDKSEEEREKIYQEIEKKYPGMRAEKLAKNLKKGIIAY